MSNTTATITPERIRALRAHLGLNQQQFAELLGLGPWRESVSRLERGGRTPIRALNQLLLKMEKDQNNSPSVVDTTKTSD